MIKYKILKSNLKTHAGGFVGRVQSGGTVFFEGLVDIVAHSRTTVAKSDVLAVLEDYHYAIEELVRDGKTVVTPHVVVRAGIEGTFEDLADWFDPARHRIVVRVSAGTRLRQAVHDVVVDKIRTDPPKPHLQVYIDVDSGTKNSVVTPGGGARIEGVWLRYDPADPAQGIFFVDQAGAETRVQRLILNTPGLLAFNVPDLAPGHYRIEVRATIRNNAEVRTGKLGEDLIVNVP
jgi:hypothetical protein